MKVETEDGKTSLVMSEVCSNDSGNYKLKVNNSEGVDEAEIRVSVIGPPTKPLGPLEVSEVSATSCKLAWKKPKSDGGSPIKLYQVEKKSVERDNWIPCAQVAGKMATVVKELEVQVTSLIEGEVYMFR